MKKYILAPLCSGLVIPGLGQILNAQVKKGLFLLSAVFILFILGSIKLAFVIKSLIEQHSSFPGDPKTLLEAVKTQHSPSLWILVALFTFLWIYSVIDAFLTGRRLEQEKVRKIL